MIGASFGARRRFSKLVIVKALILDAVLCLPLPLPLPLFGVGILSIKNIERLAGDGIEPSVSCVGDSYVNALAETINRLSKAEVIHRRGPWKSLGAIEFATPAWVDWFSHRRLMGPIGDVPPGEADGRCFAMLGEPSMAA